MPNLPDGEQPAVGLGHDVRRCRRRRRPNGPNLFNGTEGDGGRRSPRSTRWACATRRASRSTRRPTSRTRRGSARTPARPSATQGPSTYENAAQIDRAGNYGWPYCMGNGQAYRDRIGDPTAPDDPTDAAADGQRAGLRVRRPGDGRHRRLVRLQQPPQRLAEQHRPGRVPARDRHRDGRGQAAPRRTSGTAAATRATQTAARSSRASAARTSAPNYGADADPAVPVRASTRA